MKKIILFAALTLAMTTNYANGTISPSKHADAYAHLCEVNKQWLNYPSDAPSSDIQFSNDKERIRFHLLSVIEVLKQRPTEKLNQSQLINRYQLLDALMIYALQMDFPINSYHNNRQPYFIDEFDNYCAVGFMLKTSGYENIAREIQQTQNYSYLKNISHEALPSWANEFGFDLNELAWIQPSYPPSESYDAIGEGTDAEVTAMALANAGVYFIGNFQEVDGDPCQGVGFYNNGQAECVLNGLEGTLNSITALGNKIWVTGNILHNGVYYPLATFQNNAWQYHQVGTANSAIGLDVLCINSSQYYVAIQNGSNYELWLNSGNSNWVKKVTFDGPIYASVAHDGKHFFAGNFNQVTFHYAENNNQQFATNNLCSVEYLSGQWQAEAWTAYTGDVPSSIHALKSDGSALYIGGATDSSNPTALSKFSENTFNTIIVRNEFDTDQYDVRDMVLMPNSTITLAGNLGAAFISIPSMIFGQHLYSYDPNNGQTSPIAFFNQPSNCIVHFNDHLIIGGEFTENIGTYINHLARSSAPTAIDQLENEMTFTVYPNPASDYLQIDFTEPQNGELRITDLSGRVLLSENIMGKNKMTLNVSQLASQVAFVSVLENGKAVKTERLVIR